MRILAVASEGGHWIQLCRLKPLFQSFDTVYVTTNSGLASTVSGPVHIVQDANAWTKLKMLKTSMQLLNIMLRLRPDAVITTGAAPGLIAVVFGRMIGAKTIWIDSIANSEQVSGSGRMARLFAHKCLTQWESLSDDRVEYWGRVL